MPQAIADDAPGDLTVGVSLYVVMFSQDPRTWQLEMMKDPVPATAQVAIAAVLSARDIRTPRTTATKSNAGTSPIKWPVCPALRKAS